MKRTIIISFLIQVFLSSLVDAQSYEYKADLINIVNDKIKVELKCPTISFNEILYQFPKIVPGDYSICDFGKYIDDFKAYGTNGNLLKVEKIDVNSYKIYESNTLTKITYWVNDTWDSEEKENPFYPNGTNFDPGKIFIINNACLFGCFSNKESIPVTVSFDKPENLFGVTSLKSISNTLKNQVFSAKNYHRLVDCPILFAEPDTSSFLVGNTTVRIAVYNKSDNKYSQQISNTIKPSLMATESFFPDSLPIDNYTYLFYLLDVKEITKELMSDDIGMVKTLSLILELKDLNFGALEHGNSSLYYFPVPGSMPFLDGQLDKIAVHEFLHIITPLTFHSDIIENFDFNNPEMSEHLWLYEGVIEYFSGLVQLKGGLINIHQYLDDIIRDKVVESERFPNNIAFTEMSKNVFENPYKKLYYQVYQKGAILALMLDFEIMKLTNGDKSLQDVVFVLANKYKNITIKDADIIPVFVKEVHPDLQLFFNKYITGYEPYNLTEVFDAVGILYQKENQQKIPLSPISKDDNDIKRTHFLINGYFKIKKAGKNEWAGLKKGDRINKYDFIKIMKNSDGDFLEEGEIVKLPVIRNRERIILSFPMKYKDGILRNKFSIIKKQNLNATKII